MLGARPCEVVRPTSVFDRRIRKKEALPKFNQSFDDYLSIDVISMIIDSSTIKWLDITMNL